MIIADEPTTAPDVTIQAQILEVMDLLKMVTDGTSTPTRNLYERTGASCATV